MLILIKIIGIFIFCMGIIILAKPVVGRKMLAFWRQDKNLYLGASIRLLLGIIFLISASSARLPGMMFALGILTITGGAIVIVLGLNRARAMLDWLDKKANSFLRLMMLSVLLFGALLIYSA